MLQFHSGATFYNNTLFRFKKYRWLQYIVNFTRKLEPYLQNYLEEKKVKSSKKTALFNDDVTL